MELVAARKACLRRATQSSTADNTHGKAAATRRIHADAALVDPSSGSAPLRRSRERDKVPALCELNNGG